MKKLLLTLLIISLSFAFIGCDLYKGKQRVVAVTYEGPIFDANYNQQALDGLKQLASQARISYFENRDISEFNKNLETIVNEHHEFIWSIEGESKDELLNMAIKYPKQNFGIINATYDNIPSNVTSIVFKSYEAAFLAGYIAGKTTTVNKLGFLGGKAQFDKQIEYGYMAGALYAANLTDKSIEFLSDYIESYYDRETGKKRAKEMYEKGCDIIFQSAGESGLGAIDMAMELNKHIIGSGSDQSLIAPKNVLTSVIIDIQSAVNIVTTKFLEGEKIGGQCFEYGLKDRVIGIAKTITNIRREDYSQALELRRQIINESIKVPYNEETFEEFKMKL